MTDVSPCPDCGAAPAWSRCECDFVGVRAKRTYEARIADLEAEVERLRADGRCGVTPLDQCIAEQARCRDYLDGPGEDKAGAMSGCLDWLMEEAILRTDLKAPFPWFGLGLPANVESKIGSVDSSGCWNWAAAKTNGYGVVQHQGRVQRAHRVVYESLVALIPPGLELDHLCRNRSCVNPTHLEPVSGAENISRGESMSAIHARQTHCKRGHELSADNVYLRRRGMLTERFCRACSRLRDLQRYARRKSAMEVELCKS